MNDFAKLHTFESTRECRSQGNRFVHLKHSKFHNRSVTSIDFLFILKNYLDHVRSIARKNSERNIYKFRYLSSSYPISEQQSKFEAFPRTPI